MFSSIPDRYPLAASTFPELKQPKTSPDLIQCSLWDKMRPLPSLRPTSARIGEEERLTQGCCHYQELMVVPPPRLRLGQGLQHFQFSKCVHGGEVLRKAPCPKMRRWGIEGALYTPELLHHPASTTIYISVLHMWKPRHQRSVTKCHITSWDKDQNSKAKSSDRHQMLQTCHSCLPEWGPSTTRPL